MIAVTAMPLPWWARLGGCALLAANGCFLITRQALLGSPGSVTRIRLLQDGSCQLHTREQGIIDGLLRPAWYGSPLMIVLRVRCPGRRLSRSITLLPDSADADSLRRLRIFLRFALKPSVGKQ
jgi:toxin CptA